MTFEQMKMKLLNTVGRDKAEGFVVRYGKSSERYTSNISVEKLQEAINEQQNAKKMMKYVQTIVYIYTLHFSE
jgi:hypothetical protein